MSKVVNRKSLTILSYHSVLRELHVHSSNIFSFFSDFTCVISMRCMCLMGFPMSAGFFALESCETGILPSVTVLSAVMDNN